MPRRSAFGVVRGEKNIYVVLPASGTSAAEFVTDWVGGFTYTIESVKAYVAVLVAGAGATRTIRVIKGASTVAATRTLTLANGDTLGKESAFTVTAANATFTDADTLTLDIASGGTAYTGGAVNVAIVYRQYPQKVA